MEYEWTSVALGRLVITLRLLVNVDFLSSFCRRAPCQDRSLGNGSGNHESLSSNWGVNLL